MTGRPTNLPPTTERSIEPAEIDHELLAFIIDRYRRGEPLPSLGKRVPDLLAHIEWMRLNSVPLPLSANYFEPSCPCCGLTPDGVEKMVEEIDRA